MHRRTPVRAELLDYEPESRFVPQARRGPPPLAAQFMVGVFFPVLYIPLAAGFIGALSHGSDIVMAFAVVVAISGFISIALLYRIKLGWKGFIPGAITFLLLAPLILIGIAAVVCSSMGH